MHTEETITARNLTPLETVTPDGALGGVSQSLMQRVGRDHGYESWEQRHWILALRMSEESWTVCARPEPVQVPTDGCRCQLCEIN